MNDLKTELTVDEKAKAERDLWRLWKIGLDFYMGGVDRTDHPSVLALRKASRKAFQRAAERGKGTLNRNFWLADNPVESQFYRSDVPVLADGEGYVISHIPQYAYRTSRGLAMGLWYPERHKPRTKAEKAEAERKAVEDPERETQTLTLQERIAALRAKFDAAKAEWEGKKENRGEMSPEPGERV